MGSGKTQIAPLLKVVSKFCEIWLWVGYLRSVRLFWIHWFKLSGTGDSQRDLRESFAIAAPIFIARQADSPESFEFPIRASRANRFARIDSTKGLRFVALSACLVFISLFLVFFAFSLEGLGRGKVHVSWDIQVEEGPEGPHLT